MGRGNFYFSGNNRDARLDDEGKPLCAMVYLEYPIHPSDSDDLTDLYDMLQEDWEANIIECCNEALGKSKGEKDSTRDGCVYGSLLWYDDDLAVAIFDNEWSEAVVIYGRLDSALDDDALAALMMEKSQALFSSLYLQGRFSLFVRRCAWTSAPYTPRLLSKVH